MEAPIERDEADAGHATDLGEMETAPYASSDANIMSPDAFLPEDAVDPPFEEEPQPLNSDAAGGGDEIGIVENETTRSSDTIPQVQLGTVVQEHDDALATAESDEVDEVQVNVADADSGEPAQISIDAKPVGDDHDATAAPEPRDESTTEVVVDASADVAIVETAVQTVTEPASVPAINTLESSADVVDDSLSFAFTVAAASTMDLSQSSDAGSKLNNFTAPPAVNINGPIDSTPGQGADDSQDDFGFSFTIDAGSTMDLSRAPAAPPPKISSVRSVSPAGSAVSAATVERKILVSIDDYPSSAGSATSGGGEKKTPGAASSLLGGASDLNSLQISMMGGRGMFSSSNVALSAMASGLDLSGSNLDLDLSGGSSFMNLNSKGEQPITADKKTLLKKKFKMGIRSAVTSLKKSGIRDSETGVTGSGSEKTLMSAHYGTSFAGFQATADVMDGTSIAHLPVNIVLSAKPSIASRHVMAPVDRNSLMGHRLTASMEATALAAAASTSNAQAKTAMAPSGTAGYLVQKERRSSKSFIDVVAMLQSRRGSSAQVMVSHEGYEALQLPRSRTISEDVSEERQHSRLRDYAVAFIRQNRREKSDFQLDFFGDPTNIELERKWEGLMTAVTSSSTPEPAIVIAPPPPPMPVTKVSVTNRELPSRSRNNSVVDAVDQSVSNLPTLNRTMSAAATVRQKPAEVVMEDAPADERPLPSRPVTWSSSIPVPNNPKYRKVEIVPVSLAPEEVSAAIADNPPLPQKKIMITAEDAPAIPEVLRSSRNQHAAEKNADDDGDNEDERRVVSTEKPKTAQEKGRTVSPKKRVVVTAPPMTSKGNKYDRSGSMKLKMLGSTKTTVLTKNGLQLETRKKSAASATVDEMTGVLSSHMPRGQSVQFTNHIVIKGPKLPYLESRPITSMLKKRFNEWDTPVRHRADVFISQYSQPLPIKRDSNPPQKLPSRRHFLMRELRSRREMLLQEAYLGQTAVPPREFLRQMAGLEDAVGGLISGKRLQKLAPTFNTNVPSHELFSELGQVHWMERIGTRMRAAAHTVASETVANRDAVNGPLVPPPSADSRYRRMVFGATNADEVAKSSPYALPPSQKIRRQRSRNPTELDGWHVDHHTSHQYTNGAMMHDGGSYGYRGKYDHPQLVLDVSQP